MIHTIPLSYFTNLKPCCVPFALLPHTREPTSPGALEWQFPSPFLNAPQTVALLDGNQLVVANLGDSKAVLRREDGVAVDLSKEHSLRVPEEVARIVAAGLEVSDDDPPRLCGELAVARSLGDLRFKQVKGLPPEEQPLTSVPDITVTEVTRGDEFLILACDGVFEVMSSQDVVDFVHRGLTAGTPPQILVELLDACVAPAMPNRLGADNMTALLVLLSPETVAPSGSASPASPKVSP